MSLRIVCALLDLVDSDSLLVQWEGTPRQVRLLDVLPEPANAGAARPPTRLGRRTLQWARELLLEKTPEVQLEFPSGRPELSNSGRLLAYVHARGELYNARLVRDGRSPCFEKYGRPMIHRDAMERAELWARREGLGIWSEGRRREMYDRLKSWWRIRAGQVDDFRCLRSQGEDHFDCRLDYEDIIQHAKSAATIVVFADLVRPFYLSDGSILIQVGSPHQPLSAYFPPAARPLARFVEHEFVGEGKPNYLYLDAPLVMAGDQPQMTVERFEQISTCPPKVTTA
jgi:endonuclease YncB( thermonuclease family)